MDKIVLSGGWGHGNLGDDAILLATCRLLARVYPEAYLSVLTYRIDEQLRRLLPKVDFVESFHRRIDHEVSVLMYRPVAYRMSLFTKVRSKWRLISSQRETNIRKLTRGFDGREADELIKHADLFILGGGGYMNQGWLSSVAAHLHELRVARSSGVPYVVWGTGLGSFANPSVRDELFACLRSATAICVRDEFSEADLLQEEIRCTIVPDVALSDFAENASPPTGTLGIILNKSDRGFFEALALALVEARQAGFVARVTLLASRLWDKDLAAMLSFYSCASLHACPVKIVIPADVEDLELEIRKCDMVISENLQGLTLAVRNRKSVIAINDYADGSPNDRKLVAFMRQISSASFMIDRSVRKAELSSLLQAKYEAQGADAVHYEAFCRRVRERSVEFLKHLSRAAPARASRPAGIPGMPAGPARSGRPLPQREPKFVK